MNLENPLYSDLLRSAQYRYPELFWAPYTQTLPYKTLTVLGLRSSKKALEAGYICVRPSFSTGNRAYPGLWLLPEDMPLFEAAYETVRQERMAAEQRSLEKSRRALDRAAKKQQKDLLNKLSSLTSLPETQLLETISKDDFSQLGCVQSDLKSISLKLLQLYKERLPSDTAFTKKGGLLYQGHLLSTTPPTLLKALVTGDSAAIFSSLMESTASHRNKIVELENVWRARKPSWFPTETLVAWCKEQANGRGHQHPLSALFTELGIRSITIHYKWRTFSIEVGSIPLKQVWTSIKSDDRPLKVWLIERTRAIVTRIIEEKEQLFMSRLSADIPLDFFESREQMLEVISRAYLEEVENPLATKYSDKRVTQKLKSSIQSKLSDLKLATIKLACQDSLPKNLKDFYPLARSMNRRITFIMGPTNSGKTHRALNELAAAQSGTYLGPLRLLALEVHERLLENGVPNSLITGELIITDENAKHSASTIEMLDLKTPVDVAVVDEVQMLCDPDRGSAWLEAILGAPAKHLILVGSASALALVQRLTEHTGESLELISLKRLSPIEVLEKPVLIPDLEPSTALIVFSRRDVLSLAAHIRENTKHNVAVIYGALSPEVRREQARMFREGEAPILVATDAIGMGLNLPIRTLLFTTLDKWNGKTTERLSLPLFHQIAGRAGRYGLHEQGFIGALDPSTLRKVSTLWSQTPRPQDKKLLVPLSRTIAHTIATHLNKDNLLKILKFFRHQLTWHRWAMPSVTDSQMAMANYLESFQLTLDEKLTLLNAPASHKDAISHVFRPMVFAVQDKEPLTPDFNTYCHQTGFLTKLEELEEKVRNTSLYCWMHYRYRDLFPAIELAQMRLKDLNSEISSELARQAPRLCNDCGKRLHWNHPFKICDSCYHQNRRYPDWY